MQGYHHILIATDLSPQGQQTLKKALGMARESDAKVDIIHVMEHSPLAYGGEFSIPMDINTEQTIENQAQTMLREIAGQYNITADHTHLVSGSVRTEVVCLAKKLNVDLIIVGSHSGGTMGLLLGSRANAILHHANCDVLVFKQEDSE